MPLLLFDKFDKMYLEGGLHPYYNTVFQNFQLNFREFRLFLRIAEAAWVFPETYGQYEQTALQKWRSGVCFPLFSASIPRTAKKRPYSRKPRLRSSPSISSSSFSEGAQIVWKWRSSVSTFRGLSRQAASRSTKSAASWAFSISRSARMGP